MNEQGSSSIIQGTMRKEMQRQQAGLTRIEGFDLARAIAVIAMVVVNYNVIFAGTDAYPGWYDEIAYHLFGRAAVLFVTLAGIGIALISGRALTALPERGVRSVRLMLLKRSIALLIMGLLFMTWWGADILHFYGLYLAVGACLLSASDRRLWMLIAACLFMSTILFCFMDGDPGIREWVLEPGMVAVLLDDLLFSGYYAAFPWLIFLFLGMWLGKQNIMSDRALRKRLLIRAAGILAAAELLAWYVPELLFDRLKMEEGGILDLLLISNAFPISPLFAVSSAASAVLVILCALSISRHALLSRLASGLTRTGRLTLTLYVLHVLIGLAAYKLLSPLHNRAFYSVLTLSFTLAFCAASVVLSGVWFRFFAQGPLEWVMRRTSRG